MSKRLVRVLIAVVVIGLLAPTAAFAAATEPDRPDAHAHEGVPYTLYTGPAMAEFLQALPPDVRGQLSGFLKNKEAELSALRASKGYNQALSTTPGVVQETALVVWNNRADYDAFMASLQQRDPEVASDIASNTVYDPTRDTMITADNPMYCWVCGLVVLTGKVLVNLGAATQDAMTIVQWGANWFCTICHSMLDAASTYHGNECSCPAVLPPRVLFSSSTCDRLGCPECGSDWYDYNPY